jgi:hypothetical protein
MSPGPQNFLRVTRRFEEPLRLTTLLPSHSRPCRLLLHRRHRQQRHRIMGQQRLPILAGYHIRNRQRRSSRCRPAGRRRAHRRSSCQCCRIQLGESDRGGEVSPYWFTVRVCDTPSAPVFRFRGLFISQSRSFSFRSISLSPR